MIIPVFKAGEKETQKKYRRITLLTTGYKIYATLLENKLRKEVETKNILPDEQGGFRPGRSAIGNIYILNYIMGREIKKEKGKLYVLFADLKAASLTWTEKNYLGCYGKKEVNVHLINSEDHNKEKSQTFWTNKGLRQGCPRSPHIRDIYF